MDKICVMCRKRVENIEMLLCNDCEEWEKKMIYTMGC